MTISQCKIRSPVPLVPATPGLGTFSLRPHRWCWCWVGQKDPLQLPDSTPWGRELSLRWPRRRGWAKGSWWAGDDSSWKEKKVLVVDRHTLKRRPETLQFQDGYCYLKCFLKILYRCICSIIYSRQKYRFFKSSENGWKLGQCRVYGLH